MEWFQNLKPLLLIFVILKPQSLCFWFSRTAERMKEEINGSIVCFWFRNLKQVFASDFRDTRTKNTRRLEKLNQLQRTQERKTKNLKSEIVCNNEIVGAIVCFPLLISFHASRLAAWLKSHVKLKKKPNASYFLGLILCNAWNLWALFSGGPCSKVPPELAYICDWLHINFDLCI